MLVEGIEGLSESDVLYAKEGEGEGREHSGASCA